MQQGNKGKQRRGLGYLLAGAALAVLGSCRTPSSSQVKAADLDRNTASVDPGGRSIDAQYGDVRRFRAIFHPLAARAGFADADVNRLLFLPTPDMLTPSPAALAAATPEATNAAIVQQAAQYTPAFVAANAQNTPFEPDVDVDGIFAANGPATFIVIPGIFGEFIDQYALHELFTGDSSFAQAYTDKIATIQDSAFDLSALGNISVNLGDRVHLGGIDDASGAPRVQAAFLQAKLGSTETLGDEADAAAVFLRRINKMFEQIPLGSCQKIYLVGYSQGAGVAYEMATQAAADPSGNPFFKNLKGIITLAGVTYGSEVADDAMNNASSPTFKLLAQLQQLVNNLQVSGDGASFITKEGEVLHDWAQIDKFVAQLAKAPGAAVSPGQTAEHLKEAIPSPMYLFKTMSAVLTKLFTPGLSRADTLRNVARAKVLISRALVAIKGLTTASRIAWWQTHILPPTLQVLSIAGSMPDPSTADALSPLLASPYYGQKTSDFQYVLRPGYYGMVQASGTALNDSQVIEHKERIWPALITKWNPNQPPFSSYYMGILGTHHWGMAFPEAIATAGGVTNPFPRRLLAEAMAAFALAPVP